MSKLWQDTLVSIIIVFVIVVALAFSISRDWSVQRRLFVDAKPDTLLNETLEIKNWEKWNTWAVNRGITEIKIIKRNKYDATFAVKTKRGDYECLVLLSGDELGAYVILKVKGSFGKNPFARYATLALDSRFGAELMSSLETLKKTMNVKK
jgi:hypothetical protein